MAYLAHGDHLQNPSIVPSYNSISLLLLLVVCQYISISGTNSCLSLMLNTFQVQIWRPPKMEKLQMLINQSKIRVEKMQLQTKLDSNPPNPDRYNLYLSRFAEESVLAVINKNCIYHVFCCQPVGVPGLYSRNPQCFQASQILINFSHLIPANGNDATAWLSDIFLEKEI